MTMHRPDMVLLSEPLRQVIMLDLSVPWEDWIEEGMGRKRTRYTDLVKECCRQEWRTQCRPTEVGCGRFAAQVFLHGMPSSGHHRCPKKIAQKQEREEAMVEWGVSHEQVLLLQVEVWSTSAGWPRWGWLMFQSDVRPQDTSQDVFAK